MSRVRRRRLPGVGVALLLPLAAILTPAQPSPTARHLRIVAPARARQGPAAAGFPGAPATQPGHWEGGNVACPLAAPNRYLPPRSGCVSVLRADVDGAGRPDLVVLYAHLGHRRLGTWYAPTSFTLEVDRANGARARVRLPRSADNAALVQDGNLNGVPGVELIVQVAQISSGSSADIYSVHDGRLVRVAITLHYGGDSALRAGFSCHPGTHPTLVRRTYTLQGPGERGRWRQTDTIDAWAGVRLHRVARRSVERRGAPPATATGLGTGCGAIDRATAG